MKTQRQKPSAARVVAVTTLGFVIGLLVGIVAAYFTQPSGDGPSRFMHVDRYGNAGYVTVSGDTPVYLVFPVVGACLGFIWMLYLRASRHEDKD